MDLLRAYDNWRAVSKQDPSSLLDKVLTCLHVSLGQHTPQNNPLSIPSQNEVTQFDSRYESCIWELVDDDDRTAAANGFRKRYNSINHGDTGTVLEAFSNILGTHRGGAPCNEAMLWIDVIMPEGPSMTPLEDLISLYQNDLIQTAANFEAGKFTKDEYTGMVNMRITRLKMDMEENKHDQNLLAQIVEDCEQNLLVARADGAKSHRVSVDDSWIPGANSIVKSSTGWFKERRRKMSADTLSAGLSPTSSLADSLPACVTHCLFTSSSTASTWAIVLT